MKNVDSDIEKLISNIIEPTVVEVRSKLAKEYNIASEEYKDFSGLCDIASREVGDKLKSIILKEYGFDIEVSIIHGEQKHSISTPSKFWAIQHTWAMVKILNQEIYIDATSSQFKRIYYDIPIYYISKKKPKWYYPDRSNPAFNWFTGKLQRKIQIPRKICVNGHTFTGHDGLIQFLQFEVWGRIADFIRMYL